MAGDEKLHPTHHAPIGEMVAEKFSEFENMTRYSRGQSRVCKHKEENIMVEGIHFTLTVHFLQYSLSILLPETQILH